MIRVFAGKDTFESYLLAKKEVKKIKEEKNLELKIIDADDITDVSEIAQSLEGIGMFGGESILFIKRVTQNKKVIEYFVENYTALKKHEIIIWEEGNMDGKLKLTTLLKNDRAIIQFEEAKDRTVRSWYINILKDLKIKISPIQIDYIFDHLGPNKWLLYQEAKKFRVYLDRKARDTLTDSEIQSLLGFDTTGDIWKFLDFLAAKNIKSAIAEYRKLSMFDDNSQYLISMIARELSLMLQVLSATDSDNLSIHPFVLQKTKVKAAKFNIAGLIDRLKDLLDLDFNIKTGQIEEKIGLVMYILSF